VSTDGQTFVIAGVAWTDATDVWHQGHRRVCSDGIPATVELRFVRVRDDGPTRVVSMAALAVVS
jgi:hypothetical protein